MREVILQKNISFAKRIVKHLPQAIRNKLPVEITVVSVSAKESLALNRAYRKKRTPANVLSFFYSREYGEIMVCPVLIRAEAKARGNSFEYQMTWMIIHGMLHLAGIHHEASAKAERTFEKTERRALEKLAQLNSRSS
ncbi:MAG: rRNA maturation RNase YbeY [Candidatus Sungbacteria bacterium]|nr:rRNA maturation RNase YbeY [Candidatus Sungbacteria bacterium]